MGFEPFVVPGCFPSMAVGAAYVAFLKLALDSTPCPCPETVADIEALFAAHVIEFQHDGIRLTAIHAVMI